MDTKNFKVPSNKPVKLTDYDSCWLPKWAKKPQVDGKKVIKEHALTILNGNKKRLFEFQELFWASDTYAMLVILQGMDAAGKDGVIRHVMSGINPQGCEVTSFKTPSQEELDHDFLWRFAKALPERGRIGIFNRSYYEDVLIVKVRPEVLATAKLPKVLKGKDFWKERYEDINMFERHLVRNGTLVLKFFLNISKESQKKRLLKRLDEPQKNWKFSQSDLSERGKWNQYMAAYEEMLSYTSTTWAPWYVIPADKKWVSHALVSEVIVTKISELKLQYPSLSKEQCKALQDAKAVLEKEQI